MADDAKALYDRGMACVHEEEPETALTLFEQAVALAPENPHAWWALGMTAHWLEAWEQARDALARTVALGCENGRIRAKLAHALERLGQPGAAAREAERALIFPLDAATRAYLHRMLGSYQAELGDEESALRHYRAAVDLEPDEAIARHNLGLLYVRRDRFAEAVPHLARAAAALPDDVGTAYHLGRAARHVGDWETARAALERALDLDDNDPFILLELASALLALGRRAEASRHLRRALRFRLGRPARAQACALLARCRQKA